MGVKGGITAAVVKDHIVAVAGVGGGNQHSTAFGGKDIRAVDAAVADVDTVVEIAVLLAAFGPMRRGEICALESTDIKGNKVSVTKSMVLGPNQTYCIKQPKTYGSYRTIE